MLLSRATIAGSAADAAVRMASRDTADAGGFQGLLALLTGAGQDATAAAAIQPMPGAPGAAATLPSTGPMMQDTATPASSHEAAPATQSAEARTDQAHSAQQTNVSLPPPPSVAAPVPPVAATAVNGAQEDPSPAIPAPAAVLTSERLAKIAATPQRHGAADKAPTNASRDATPADEPVERHQPDAPPQPYGAPATNAMAQPPAPQPANERDPASKDTTASVGAIGNGPSAVSAAKPQQHDAPPGPGDAAALGTSAAMVAHPAPKDAVAEASRTEAAIPQRALTAAGETVAARIGRAVQDGTHVLTMELHPAELGRVEVRLSFHDGGIGVQMTLDRPETYDAFSRNRGGMEQQLADAGINLGSGGLDLRFGQQSGHPAPQPGATAIRIPLPAETVPANRQPSAVSMHDGLIDILA